jgi:hypothetical protein
MLRALPRLIWAALPSSNCELGIGLEELLAKLQSGPKTSFRDFDRTGVPSGAGVYTIWDRDERLVYVGMSGRGLRLGDPIPNRPHGLVTRLTSHARGRRSGDQFCVYVADRFVLPRLSAEHIEKIGSGELSLDDLVKAHIHLHFSLRFASTATAKDAFAVERAIQRGSWPPGRPLLNGA